MPLNTRIERDGAVMPLPWGQFHVTATILASSIDADQAGEVVQLFEVDPEGTLQRELLAHDPIPITPRDCFLLVNYGVMAATPLNSGSYMLQKAWSFIDTVDGEMLRLKRGDVLTAVRG